MLCEHITSRIVGSTSYMSEAVPLHKDSKFRTSECCSIIGDHNLQKAMSGKTCLSDLIAC